MMKTLHRSYSRLIGCPSKASTIIKDLQTKNEYILSSNSIYAYLRNLQQIFVIEEANAWNPNLRSKTATRTSNTNYFIDPSIATAALGFSPNDLINDLKTMGFLFENLCIRDLRIYSQKLGGQVFHYRDKYGLECDAIIHLENGSYALVEIKLGGDKSIEEGAKVLNKLSEIIDSNNMKKPSFKMVLTGVGNFAYKRKDNILIVAQ
nr:DUF4143 domain-containing protein [[Mycoplasma] testudinis]